LAGNPKIGNSVLHIARALGWQVGKATRLADRPEPGYARRLVRTGC
jgi:hypothetical protein